jgi:membrane protein implicated in regulation of membrane protease activity
MNNPLSTPADNPGYDEQARVMPIDAEHAGIRLALPIITIAGFAAAYLLTSWLLAAVNVEVATGCIAFAVAIVAALLAAMLGDRFLKRLWPSGRALVLDNEGLRLRDQRKGRSDEIRLHWDQRINPQAWRFAVNRGSARVPKGWMMLGVQLLQDDAQLILYSFMSAKDAAALPAYSVFTPLVSRSTIEKGNLSIREMSEQRRLLKIEDERWRDGAEIRKDDFIVLLHALTDHIPEWQRHI